MTPHRILNLNALSTAACAVGMLATRRALHLFFGLQTPMLLDVVALGLLAYAAALSVVARRQMGRRYFPFHSLSTARNPSRTLG